MADCTHYNHTTIRHPNYEIVRVDFEMIEGDTPALLQAATTIRLSGELIERRSTGAGAEAL